MLRDLFTNPADVGYSTIDTLYDQLRNGVSTQQILEEMSPANAYNKNKLHSVLQSPFSYFWPSYMEFLGHVVEATQGDKSAVVEKVYAMLMQRQSYFTAPDKQKDRPVDLLHANNETNKDAYVDLIRVLVVHGLARGKAEVLLSTEKDELLPRMLARAKKLYAYDMLAFLDCGFLNRKELGGMKGFSSCRKTALKEIAEHEKCYVPQVSSEPYEEEDGFVLVGSPAISKKPSSLLQFHLHAQPADALMQQARFERSHQTVVIYP